jgi:hypothetical protein
MQMRINSDLILFAWKTWLSIDDDDYADDDDDGDGDGDGMARGVWQGAYGNGRQFRHGVSEWVEDGCRTSALQNVTPEMAVMHFQGWLPTGYRRVGHGGPCRKLPPKQPPHEASLGPLSLIFDF